MRVQVESPFEFKLELGALRPPAGGGDSAFAPLFEEALDADLGDLIDEAFTAGVLAGRLDADLGSLAVSIRPTWKREPIVDRIRVELRSDAHAREPLYVGEFARGRWSRRYETSLGRLRKDGHLGEEERAYLRVVALGSGGGADVLVPPLAAPELAEQSLDELGVRELGAGALDPERPVLINRRAVDEILDLTVKSGASEAGGGMLGKLVRLPEPLAGTHTRTVTVLTTGVVDERHVGAPGRFTFSNEALVDALGMAELRGRGESVLTAFHTHGWGTGCDNCNQKESCALPQCTYVSHDDYQVLESLFPSKATLMPIAGRRLGAPGSRPVLAVHAWRGGEMGLVDWRAYED